MLIFDYLYRDASNYKAYGSIWLTGRLSETDREALVECLDGRTYFVAEQVGIPALCDELFQWSNGPNDDDHAWHEFVGFRESIGGEEPPARAAWLKASDLLAVFVSARNDWRPELSPNFALSFRPIWH